jgi:protein phosphatase
MNEDFINELSRSDSPSPESAEQVLPTEALDAPPNVLEAAAPEDSLSENLRTTDPASPSIPPSSLEARTIRLAVSALSDVGCVRTNNEDSFGYDEGVGIFVVCDGMGGMASGEVASSRAVAAIVSAYAESAASGVPVSTRLLHAINTANADVWENGQIPENKGMGTTAVVAALDGDKLILGNVGDSRAYIIQGEQAVQLTVDHSYVNELIRNGTLTIENARTADLRGMESIITRAVGVAADVQPDFFSVDLKPGITVLLATDGLTRYLLQDEIAAILAASPFDSACFNLINQAKQRGGQDNITCILLHALPD